MPTTAIMSSRATKILGALICGIYLSISVATLLTARPQTDEAIYANPGYNLIYNGRMATTLYELRGFMPLSMAERTYWQPPLYFLTTAAWYRLVGFGLFQVRILSVLFGLLAIYSWFMIGRCLSGSSTLALLMSGLVSIDYFFVLGASQGRMDMMCAALGVAAIAVYLRLRVRCFPSAIFWSHALATMSVLTHPVGLSYWLGLMLLIVYFDRRSLSFNILLLAATPCLAGGVGWGLYIAQDPVAFVTQIHRTLEINKYSFEMPNLSSIGFVRNLQLELHFRYVGPFGFGPGVGPAQRTKALVLLTYVVGVIGTFILSSSRERRNIIVLPALALVAILYLALVSPSKFSYYLPHTTMFMAACLAAFLYYLKLSARRKQIVAVAALTLVGGIQAGGLLYRVHQNPYGHSFVPAVESIVRNSAPGTVVVGSGELWFRLQPERSVLHDPALGFRNGMEPRIFVMDPLYRELYERERQAGSPIYSWVRDYLDRSRSVYADGYYQVYVH